MDPLAILARIRAHMLTTRILILGFVCIEWGWVEMLVTLAVWMCAEQWLTGNLYEEYTKEFALKVKMTACSHEEDEDG